MLLHVSHNDLDGAGCGILTQKYLKNVHNVYLNYGEVDDYLLEHCYDYDAVLVTDVSPDRDTIMKISGNSDITLIDHHRTTESLKDLPFVIHDSSKSATLLTLEWIESQGIDASDYHNLVDCINDFDLWKLKRKDSLQMNMLFMLYGIERIVNRFIEEPYHAFRMEEQLLISVEEERRDKYIDQTTKTVRRYTDVEGREMAFVFAESYNSELGNHIVLNTGVDYVLIVNMQRMKASLRSRAEIDISGIAEANGGGGHKNAAGFTVTFPFNIEDFLAETGIID